MAAIRRVRQFVLAAIAASLLAPGMAPHSRAAEPEALPALVKVRYIAGKGEEFRVQDAAGIRAVLAWLAKVADGRMSEHENIGLCFRDGEIEFYRAAGDRLPSRTVSLFIGCGHVSGRVVTAEQFAALRAVLVAAGKERTGKGTVANESREGRVRMAKQPPG